MSWSKIKSMFVVSEGPREPAREAASSPDDVIKELEKYQLAPDASAPLPSFDAGYAVSAPSGMASAPGPTVPATGSQGAPVIPSQGAAGGAIDFQSLYDQAGIPNTDEVEALERFLGGLDASLPETSKVAAAKAFLGAIGKAPKDVIDDAGRKITVVRIVADTKRTETEHAVGAHQAEIAELQRQIDAHRVAIEGLQKELESVRSQCAVEESRLQGARMFFGHMGDILPRSS